MGFLLVLSDEIHEGSRPTATSSARHVGKTIIKYLPSPILYTRASWDARDSPDLHVTYRRRKGTTRIGGKSPGEWKKKKEDTLKDGLLFGPDELFGSITVDTDPRT